MPFFSTPRASMAMPRAHANSGERKTLRALGRLLPARQSPRTFPRFFAFSMGCRQENFPCRPLRAPRAPMAAPRAHANPAASEEPPRPRLVAPSPSSVVEKISTFCAFSMRCGQEKFASPFRSRDPRCRVRRSSGAAGTSRAAVFASSRAVAVDGAAHRRSPVLVENARRAFTHRPTVVGGGGRGSRRIEAQRHE